MGQQEFNLELRRGETLIAKLDNIELYDWPWYSCDFNPTAEFEQYRQLFEKENFILQDDGATEAWNTLYEEIIEIGLTLYDPKNNELMGPFFGHIEGDKASFRAVKAPTDV